MSGQLGLGTEPATKLRPYTGQVLTTWPLRCQLALMTRPMHKEHSDDSNFYSSKATPVEAQQSRNELPKPNQPKKLS